MISTPAAGVVVLLDNVAATQFGAPFYTQAFNKVIEATLDSTPSTTCGATIEIYGNTRNDNVGGVLLATITLNGTTPQRDGFAFDAPWPYIYARLQAISGANARVVVDMAV